MAEQVPSEILRIMASHGSMRLICGGGGSAEGTTCHVAPFDDVLYCLVGPGSSALNRLLESPKARLELENGELGYKIKIRGRAVPGRSVLAHARRSELLHWVPEGQNPRALLAVPLWPEHIHYEKGTEVFDGETPLGSSRKGVGALWKEAAFYGILPVFALSWVCLWSWVAYAGNGDVVWQAYSLALSGLAVSAIQLGSNLIYQSLCFQRVLKGQLLPKSAPLLSVGLLSHRSLWRGGWILMGVGSLSFLLLEAIDPLLRSVVAGISLMWLVWPFWAIHLFLQDTETD